MQEESVQAAEILFAVGGGRVCDTVKVVGEKLAKPVFTFPTIGSNCSPSQPCASSIPKQAKCKACSFLQNRRSMPLLIQPLSPQRRIVICGPVSVTPYRKRSKPLFLPEGSIGSYRCIRHSDQQNVHGALIDLRHASVERQCRQSPLGCHPTSRLRYHRDHRVSICLSHQ